MRYVVIALLLVAAHFSLTAFVPTGTGQAWIGWPFAVDSRPILAGVGGLPQQSGSVMTPALAGIAGLGFLLAAVALVGWWVPLEWWNTLTVTASVSSLLLFVLHMGPWAVLPIAIDLVLLWGVVGLHWTAAMLRGG